MIDKFIIDKINFVRNNKVNNKDIIDLNNKDWNIIDKIMKEYKLPKGKGYNILFEICIFEYKNQKKKIYYEVNRFDDKSIQIESNKQAKEIYKRDFKYDKTVKKFIEIY